MRQRAQGSSPAIKGNDNNVHQRRGADRRRLGSSSNITISGGAGGGTPATSSGEWEITSGGGDVSLMVDRDDLNSSVMPKDQKMHEVDLNHHQFTKRYQGASPLHQRTSPSPHHRGGGPHQQYASALYQKTSLNEESLRKFGSTSPLNISTTKSATSSNLLASWKLDQTRLEDYHTVFRTPLHVPDSEYEAYLLGKSRRKDLSIITKKCCATTCAGFSAVGVAFLLFIGILLDKQPLFIPGTLPELVVQSTFQYKNNDGDEVVTYTKPVIQYLVPGPADERLPIASTAYKAAAAYLCTLVASLYVLDPTRFQFITRFFVKHILRRSQSSSGSGNILFQYSDIPDLYDNLPSFSNSDVRSSSYQPGLWNRTTGRVKRWLAVRGWYRVRRRNKSKKKG